MKLRPLLLIVLVVLTIITGCKKRNCCIPPVIPLYAQKDGVDWTTSEVATGYKPLSTKDTLFITARKGEETLVIAVAQKGVASYQYGEFKAYYHTTVGQDAVTSKYQLQADASNRFEILGYSEAYNVLNASFSFSFKNTYPLDNTVPATIKFAGSINTKLSQIELNPFH